MTDIPKGLSIGGAKGDFHLRIGELDLSGALVDHHGPIVETLMPGPNPVRLAWVPFMFEGAVDDPEGLIRIVREGEAESVGLPGED